MSYAISLFHPEVRHRAEAGAELDAFLHPKLEPTAVVRFVERLLRWGYALESTT
jgi:hypothetical protein